MGCYRPTPAYQEGATVKLWPPLGTSNLALPCGNCVGCRTAKATEWARRAEHESRRSRYNSFITLTYADDKVPTEGLRPHDLTDFIKRLRKRATLRSGAAIQRDHRLPIRYFACGEYGEKNGRPHFHIITFNAGFNDGRTVGKDLYESALLKELWPHGRHAYAEATPASANYIAQYTLKKQAQHRIDQWNKAFVCLVETREHISRSGEIIPQPPFLRMSLKPAIGKPYAERYHADLVKGYLVTDGVKHAIPRYYTKLLKQNHPQLYDLMQANIANARSRLTTDKNTPARLQDAELIHKQRKQQTERKL